MRDTIFLLGPSDIEGQSSTQIKSTDGGKLSGSASWSGIMPIQPYIASDSALKAKSHFLMLGIQELRLSQNGKHNFFNLVGDADSSASVLRSIQELEYKTQPVRTFNRASDVFKTARETLPDTLKNIPGCRLPRVIAVQPESFDALRDDCERFAQWPLIVRASGYHGGDNMILLETPEQLESLRDTEWVYKGILLIEFVSYKGEDNLYRKVRVMMIDGVPLPRHCIITDNCFIHAENRSDLMDKDDNLCREEETFLEQFEDTCLAHYGDVFNAIYERIGLDVFGIDLAFHNDEIVLFEANACMNFLNQDYGSNGRFQYLEKQVKLCKRAVKKLLLNG